MNERVGDATKTTKKMNPLLRWGASLGFAASAGYFGFFGYQQHVLAERAAQRVERAVDAANYWLDVENIKWDCSIVNCGKNATDKLKSAEWNRNLQDRDNLAMLFDSAMAGFCVRSSLLLFRARD